MTAPARRGARRANYHKRALDVICGGLDATVAVAGQCGTAALASDDVADDGLARHAHHVGQHFRELYVHLHQGLLHRGQHLSRAMTSRIAAEVFAMQNRRQFLSQNQLP